MGIGIGRVLLATTATAERRATVALRHVFAPVSRLVGHIINGYRPEQESPVHRPDFCLCLLISILFSLFPYSHILSSCCLHPLRFIDQPLNSRLDLCISRESELSVLRSFRARNHFKWAQYARGGLPRFGAI